MEQNTDSAVPHRLAPPDVSIFALTKLSAPIFIANLAVLGNVTIDTIMAGRMSAEDLAAVALGGAATASIVMFLVGILQGLSPICGHHFGARKHERVGFEINQALYIALILSVTGIPLLCWTSFWTDLGQVRGHIAELASVYLIASACSLPAALVNRIFVSVNAAVSKPLITMWISLGMLALKAPANAVFMYGLFGFPALGGGGAGIATALLTWGATLAFLAFYFFDGYFKKFHTAHWFGPDLRALRDQLKIGIPIGLSVFFEVSSFTMMAIFISRMGAVAVSAHQIVSNIMSLLYMVPLSLGIASSVLVAQSLGSGHAEVAETASKRGLGMTLSIALFACLMLYCFNRPIIGIYTTDAMVIGIAQSLILCGIVYHSFDAAQSVASFILRGYRIAWIPMIVSGVALWCLGLGGGYLLAFTHRLTAEPLGPLGFWISCAAGLAVAGVALVSYTLFHAKKVRLAGGV